jgi:hypothetical protein
MTARGDIRSEPAHPGRLLFAGLAFSILLMAAESASAVTPTPTQTTGPIQIGGTEPLICSAAFDQPTITVNLVENTSQNVGVSIQCNTRFRLDAKSQFGVLRNETQYVAGDPLTFVPYSVVWPTGVVNSFGTPIAPAFTDTGANWAAGLSATSAPTREVQHGQMNVQWGAAPQVLAGTYVDTFTLNIVAN